MKPIRELLKEIAHSSDPDRAVTEHAYQGFSESEKKEFEQKYPAVYAGKVRELIRTENDLLIYHTDRLSAFDRFIGLVPYKGTILAEISQYWLEEAADVVPTHFLGRPHERVLRCISCTPYKVEVVVRGYMAGSMMRAYQKGIREFCGEKLPEGLEPYRSLPEPIITPTTKAAAFEHDEDATPEQLVQQGVCTREEWVEISQMALKLFRFGQQKYAEKGWILVDTKYEFGRDGSGQIRLIDEIHTPDSSRLWVKSSYETNLGRGDAPEMLDKETVRRYLLELGFSGQGTVPHVPVSRLLTLAETYLQVAETLTGRPLMSAGPLSQTPRV
ncbi:phosphoribosylaminoimidazolesuccinocarboxamide synthase [Oligoflexus tunisiensis]|uniref:phosphoribosylaminoimidazolesuccinocarboxamide synthase n=1 Tax=Oligoflexus tunisiensis TaxID=708132 RepID=UPI000AFC4E25|nr:phosphoribosylaminoimidazolesuccinocarboxamide synthase [Oligoflexus tunisiensis]